MGPTAKGSKSSDTKHEAIWVFVATSVKHRLYMCMHMLKRAS